MAGAECTTSVSVKPAISKAAPSSRREPLTSYFLLIRLANSAKFIGAVPKNRCGAEKLPLFAAAIIKRELKGEAVVAAAVGYAGRCPGKSNLGKSVSVSRNEFQPAIWSPESSSTTNPNGLCPPLGSAL